MRRRPLGDHHHLEAGSYKVPSNYNLEQVVALLEHNISGPEVTVTVPEGYTDKQIVSVIFNMGANATTTSLKLDGAPGTLANTPVDLLTGQPANIDPHAINLGPGSALVLDWTKK